MRLKEHMIYRNHCTALMGSLVLISFIQKKPKTQSEISLEKHCCLQQDLAIYKTISGSVIKLKQLIIFMSVEENPGPEFFKIICGTFNQGNNYKFGNMAGKQCCTIALYSLAFSTVKDVSYWKTDTLDSILEHGTALYEVLNKDCFLFVEDLPEKVEIFNEAMNVEFKFNFHGFLNGKNLM